LKKRKGKKESVPLPTPWLSSASGPASIPFAHDRSEKVLDIRIDSVLNILKDIVEEFHQVSDICFELP